MDFRIGTYLDGLRDRVSKRVRSLRKNDSGTRRLPGLSLKFHPRFKSGIFATAFFAIAGILAWSAQDLTYSHALRDWERSRLPSDRIWTYALGNHGRIVPPLSAVVHQALKKLPASLDSPGSVWASPGLEWIVVFIDPNQTVSHKVFCRDCKKPPERWDPMGTGWSAFDQIMERFEKAPVPSLSDRKSRKTIKFVDPREIHY
jgi:hypothetical protein